MPIVTNIRNHAWDGDGGEYWSEWDVFEQDDAPQETLLRIRVVNRRTTDDVNYSFTSPTAGLNIDSWSGDPAYPPVAPGETVAFPADQNTAFNDGAGIAMDDLPDFNASMA